MKINNILFLILMGLFNQQIFATTINENRIKIVTSITPLAAIIAMLVKDKADIISIANNNDCPHHFNLKPSDLLKVQEADIVFYIDEQFDGFAAKLMKEYSKNFIKVSDFPGLHIINDNWHIWLDLNNVKILLEQYSEILVKNFPLIAKDIYYNFREAKKQLDQLTEIKKNLYKLKDIILLDDSLEYFFDNGPYKTLKLYNSGYKSLSYPIKLKKLLDSSTNRCLILSETQDSSLYKNLDATIIKIQSENWQIVNIDSNLFYSQYLKMINQVSKCLNY